MCGQLGCDCENEQPEQDLDLMREAFEAAHESLRQQDGAVHTHAALDFLQRMHTHFGFEGSGITVRCCCCCQM